MKTQISEVFSSIQGEGILVGRRQLFIRFLGCNLNCAYCDTSYSLNEASCYSVETIPGKGEQVFCANPVKPEELMEVIRPFFAYNHHSVSLTGGEPLLHDKFLTLFLPLLRGAGQKIYLETNGTLPQTLSKVINDVDIVGMDIKFPSSTGLEAFYQLHRQFLSIANQKEVFVKAVVTNRLSQDELNEAIEMIGAVDSSIPLILQPVTPLISMEERPEPFQLIKWQDQALKYLKDVRVVPQTHLMINLR